MYAFQTCTLKLNLFQILDLEDDLLQLKEDMIKERADVRAEKAKLRTAIVCRHSYPVCTINVTVYHIVLIM